MLEKYLLCFACAKLEKDLVQLVKKMCNHQAAL